MQYGECLHGVGSNKQSMFPQNLALGASFDTDLAHRVGRALGTEARSIGIHACLSPVLDLSKDSRWGRVQGSNFACSSETIYLTGPQRISAKILSLHLISELHMLLASQRTHHGQTLTQLRR